MNISTFIHSDYKCRHLKSDSCQYCSLLQLPLSVPPSDSITHLETQRYLKYNDSINPSHLVAINSSLFFPSACPSLFSNSSQYIFPLHLPEYIYIFRSSPFDFSSSIFMMFFFFFFFFLI